VLNALNNRVQNSTPTSVTNIDEFTGIDERIEDQIEIDDGLFGFSELDERIEDQIEIDDGLFGFSELDERIEDQIEIDDGTLGFDELGERIEDQIEIDDGTLGLDTAQDETIEEQKIPDEFDGIDEQIADNENALNEPPATEVDEFTGIDENKLPITKMHYKNLLNYQMKKLMHICKQPDSKMKQ